MAAMSSLESFVATYTLKHKSNEFACDAKIKESPWAYVQELFEEQVKATKKNKKLKSLAIAGMYAACMAMNAKIKQLEMSADNTKIKISEKEKENTSLHNQVQALTTLNQMVKASQEENFKNYKLAQKEVGQYKDMLNKVETERDHIISAYKVVQDQLLENKKGKIIDHAQCKQKESQLLQTISILKGQAAVANRFGQGNATAPTCAYEIGDSEDYEEYWGEEDMYPDSAFPVAMGEIAEPQENREATLGIDNGDQGSTNEEQDKFPIMCRTQVFSSPEGNRTFVGFDGEGNEIISNAYPTQPVKTLMSVADFIGKIKSNEHITSHATNVQQRCELLGVKSHSDQVKVLQLTLDAHTWNALPDSIKEGKGSYKETVAELQKVINPSAIGLMVAYEIKQNNEENPLLYANRLWAAYNTNNGKATREDIEYKNLLIHNAHPAVRVKCEHLIDPRKHSYEEVIGLIHRSFQAIQSYKQHRLREKEEKQLFRKVAALQCRTTTIEGPHAPGESNPPYNPQWNKSIQGRGRGFRGRSAYRGRGRGNPHSHQSESKHSSETPRAPTYAELQQQLQAFKLSPGKEVQVAPQTEADHLQC